MNNCEYELEELIPIVTYLAEKFTRKESSSITYEKARQLMEAVEYCIKENQLVEQDVQWNWWIKEHDIRTESILQESVLQESLSHDEGKITAKTVSEDGKITAKAAYELGYHIVLEKVNQIRTIYNQLIETFDAYGNRNYEDTVKRGIPGFLLYYDARFEPQNHILSMDYPVLVSLEHACGADVILDYVKGIALEQQFLQQLPKDYIEEILSQYHGDYKNMYFNLCIPVLHQILGRLIVGKRLMDSMFTQQDYETISEYVRENQKDQLINDCTERLRQFLGLYYEGATELFHYLGSELENFVTELENAVRYDCVETIFSQD